MRGEIDDEQSKPNPTDTTNCDERCMSVGLFGLAGASIAQVEAVEDSKKPPPKRRAYAKADAAVVPEPR
jgi:hypothetical protein